MLNFDTSHLIVRRGSRVPRARPHHTLTAFQNLNGSVFNPSEDHYKKTSN